MIPSHTENELKHLANQVLWPGFFGQTVPDWLARELKNGLAGVLYFSHNLSDPQGNAKLAKEIYSYHAQPLIGVDEEGGTVTHFEAKNGSTLPSAAQLGYIDDVSLTQLVGSKLAAICERGGANVVLAPVADVNTNPKNPVIGVRSFGSQAPRVSRHVRAMVIGIQGTGSAACAKHWPGHGDTELDSHLSLPKISAGIYTQHLAPFRASIDAGVAMIMSAHIVVPEWGPLPVTINPTAIGALRTGSFDGGAGYQGVIVTDALDMAAIRKEYGSGQGAVMALNAGVDLLCIGNPANPGRETSTDLDEQDFLEIRDAIVMAILDGELAVEKVEQAATRVKSLATHLHGNSSHLVPSFASAYDDLLPQLRQEPHQFITVAPPVEYVALEAAPAGQPLEQLSVATHFSAESIRELGKRIHDWPVLDMRDQPTLAQFDSHHSVAWQLTSNPNHTTARTRMEVDQVLDSWKVKLNQGILAIIDSTVGNQSELVHYLAKQPFETVVINVGLPGQFAGVTTINTRGSSLLTRKELAQFFRGGE